MKKTIAALLIAVLAFAPAHTASAHVLITDTAQQKGAVLHIVPDDDPIAGQPATLYLDMQNRSAATVSLAVTDSENSTDTIALKQSGALAYGNYTFPTQGIYKLVFTVKSGSDTATFEHTQRVSRGVAGSALDKPTHTWAEALAVAAGAGLLLLAIVAFNRRHDIARQSTF